MILDVRMFLKYIYTVYHSLPLSSIKISTMFVLGENKPNQLYAISHISRHVQINESAKLLLLRSHHYFHKNS
jgi:hypothetical protein